jgi:lipopolysaccharide transport system permease protein
MKALSLLKETYQYRALLSALVSRHLRARYRGSFLGFFWSLLNPLFLMGVYTLVFHYYIRFAEVENYTIFLFTGLLPWIWFSTSLVEGTASISGSGSLITKSMFPAHVLPTVSVLTALVNFLLSLPLLFLFMVASGMTVHLSTLMLAVILPAQFFFLYGIVLILSSLNVYFRDVQHLIGNILSLVFFLCPVIYPISTVPERFRFTFELNPFALMVSVYHSILLDGQVPSLEVWISLYAWSLVALIVGAVTYENYRESFAELL